MAFTLHPQRRLPQIAVSEEVHRALRIRAAEQGLTIGKVVENLVLHGALGRLSDAAGAVGASFPVTVDIPPAPPSGVAKREVPFLVTGKDHEILLGSSEGSPAAKGDDDEPWLGAVAAAIAPPSQPAVFSSKAQVGEVLGKDWADYPTVSRGFEDQGPTIAVRVPDPTYQEDGEDSAPWLAHDVSTVASKLSVKLRAVPSFKAPQAAAKPRARVLDATPAPVIEKPVFASWDEVVAAPVGTVEGPPSSRPAPQKKQSTDDILRAAGLVI